MMRQSTIREDRWVWRLGAGVRAVAAVIVLGLLLAGIPLFLAVWIGNPAPGLGDLLAGDVSDRAVIAVLASITWLATGVAWAQFAVAVAVNTFCLLTRIPIPNRIPGVLPSQQQLARALVTAVLVLTPSLATITGTAHAATTASGRPTAAAPVATWPQLTNASPTENAGESSPKHTGALATTIRHTVTAQGPGTFWDLATTYLGDGQRWAEIWHLNEGRRQDDGTLMSTPGFLSPGWTVLIPVPAQATLATKPPPALIPGSALTMPAVQAPEGSPPGTSATAADTVGEPSAAGLGLGHGAGLLSAATLLALLEYRRRQFRYRRPGQAIAATPPDLGELEKTLFAQGGQFLGDVAMLDQVLRALAEQMTASGDRLPDLIAVRIGAQIIELVLAPSTGPAPPDLPVPWHRDPVTSRWQFYRSDHVPDTPEQVRRRWYQFPPYPTLASIGYSPEGDYWLLDLERAGLLRLVGDRERCLDLARFLAADLAHNVWSEELDVTLVGFEDLTDLNPGRLTQGRQPDPALHGMRNQLRVNQKLLADTGLGDTLRGRQEDVAADQWMPQLLFIDEAVTAGDPLAAQTLREMAASLRGQQRRTAVVMLVVASPSPGTPDTDDEQALLVDAEGNLHIPGLGVKLHAQQLRSREATQLAQLLAATADLQGRPMPAAHGQEAWDLLSDAGGAPITELTTARTEPTTEPGTRTGWAAPPAPNGPQRVRLRLAPEPTEDEDPAPGEDETNSENTSSSQTETPTPPAVGRHSQPAPAGLHLVGTGPRHGYRAGPNEHALAEASSVLDQPTVSILAKTATTAQDVQVLAPSVPDPARRRIVEADPNLDRDLAAWLSPDTTRPRLSLLGPVQVRAQGTLPADRPRLPWHTEVVAYLGAHLRGLTAEQLAAGLWPHEPHVAHKTKLRQSMYLVRKWLGEDPDTQQPYLPSAKETKAGGDNLYRIDGLLSDADLFRRLRLRGVANGKDGVDDLEAALNLVTGPPFDRQRRDGYSWLVDIPLDHEYTAMIVDVAHLVATHHLATGHPDLAAQAAQVSLLTASRDDIALLDLVAASDAQGNHREADVWIKRILANHDTEIEEDLPPRTAEILHRRRWIER